MRLSAGVREDFAWWLQFSKTFNVYATILGYNTESLAVYSDASLLGYGALFKNNWIVGNFDATRPPNIIKGCEHHWVPVPPAVSIRSHINEKEMAAVYSACFTWSHKWKDR